MEDSKSNEVHVLAKQGDVWGRGDDSLPAKGRTGKKENKLRPIKQKLGSEIPPGKDLDSRSQQKHRVCA